MSFGTWGDREGELSTPTAVAAASNGNIYVLDTGNDRVQEFDSTGSFLSTWGQTGKNPGEFRFPLGLACDKEGNVFVIDTGNHRIQRFSP
jgi:DNA-binding beta-propeller fold protein YncE